MIEHESASGMPNSGATITTTTMTTTMMTIVGSIAGSIGLMLIPVGGGKQLPKQSR